MPRRRPARRSLRVKSFLGSKERLELSQSLFIVDQLIHDVCKQRITVVAQQRRNNPPDRTGSEFLPGQHGFEAVLLALGTLAQVALIMQVRNNRLDRRIGEFGTPAALAFFEDVGDRHPTAPQFPRRLHDLALEGAKSKVEL